MTDKIVPNISSRFSSGWASVPAALRAQAYSGLVSQSEHRSHFYASVKYCGQLQSGLAELRVTRRSTIVNLPLGRRTGSVAAGGN